VNAKTTRTAAEIHTALRLLYAERALAEVRGFASNASYMADLLDDIHHHKSAFVGTVLTEIATLRAELNGRLQG
jgi:hypothetical protein